MANQYPKYNFADPSLDYDLVLETTLLMLSDSLAQDGCCPSARIEKVYQEIFPYLYIAPYDKINNTERYKADVKSAYLTLYPVV